MCDVSLAIAGIAAAAGTYMQQKAANDAADNQQDALNRALVQQDEYSRQAESKALENAGEYDMAKRTQRLDEAKADAGESLTQSLIKSREQGVKPEQAEGRISEAFTTDRATKLADQFQKSVDMARLMGNMRGVQDMLGNEAITNADYASQLGIVGRNARGAYGAAQPGIAAAGQPNGNLMAAGGLLQGAGSAYMGNNLGSYFGNTNPSIDGISGKSTFGTSSSSAAKTAGLMR